MFGYCCVCEGWGGMGGGIVEVGRGGVGVELVGVGGGGGVNGGLLLGEGMWLLFMRNFFVMIRVLGLWLCVKY